MVLLLSTSLVTPQGWHLGSSCPFCSAFHNSFETCENSQSDRKIQRHVLCQEQLIHKLLAIVPIKYSWAYRNWSMKNANEGVTNRIKALLHTALTVAASQALQLLLWLFFSPSLHDLWPCWSMLYMLPVYPAYTHVSKRSLADPEYILCIFGADFLHAQSKEQ